MSRLQPPETPGSEAGRGYDAFLSYSHKHDELLAQALQAAIEAMARPVPFVRRLRVFRDESDLEATPHLWGSIQRELVRSRYLVLLASPAAVASRWVPGEVEEFLRHHSVEQVLIVLAEGTSSFLPREPGAPAVPTLLEEAFQRAGAEPLVLDLRELRGLDARSLRRSPRLAEVAARVSARLLGVPLAELWGVHRRVRRRWSLLLGATAAALLTTLGVAVWNGLRSDRLEAAGVISEEEKRKLAEQQMRLSLDSLKATEGLLVKALAAAEPYLTPPRPLPAELREDLAAAIAASAELRVLGHSDEGGHVIALCPRWDLALTWHPQHGLVKWSISTGAPVVLRDDGPRVSAGSCAAQSRIAVVHGSSGGPPWVETWDLVQGRRLARMEGELWADIFGSALSGDGTVAAAALQDGMVYTWDASTGKRLRRFRQPEHTGSQLVFSPAGGLLVAGGGPGQRTTVWDYRSGTLRATLEGQLGSDAPSLWTPDGRQLLLTGKRQVTVTALDGTVVQEFPVRAEGIWQVGFDTQARRILVVGRDGVAGVVDRATGQELPRLTGHAGPVLAAAFSRDGHYAATVGRDHSLRLWDASTGELLKVFWHADSLEPFVAFTPDGALVTATRKGRVHVWSIRAGLFVGVRNGSCPPASGEQGRLVTAMPGPGHVLIACPHSGKLHLVNVETGQEEDVIGWQPLLGMTDAALSRDGRRLLLGGLHGSISWFDRDKRRWTSAPLGSMESVTQVAWEPSGRRFAFATEGHPYGRAVVSRDVEQRDEAHRFWTKEEVTGLFFDSMGKRLLVSVGGDDPNLWSISDDGEERELGKPPPEDPGPAGGLHTLHTLSASGRYLAWNLDTGTARSFGRTELLAPFLRPSRPQFQLQYDDEKGQLIVGDPETGVPLVSLAPEPAVPGAAGRQRTPGGKPVGAFLVEEDRALLVHGDDGWLRKWLLPEPMPRGDTALVSGACERLSAISRARVPLACARAPAMAEHR